MATYWLQTFHNDEKSCLAWKNNRAILRECDTDYDEALEFLNGKKYGVLNLKGACMFQEEGESLSEFLLRIACEGKGPDFEECLIVNDIHDCAESYAKIVKTIDCRTGKEI